MITDHMIAQVRDAIVMIPDKTRIDFTYDFDAKTAKWHVVIRVHDKIHDDIFHTGTVNHVITPGYNTMAEAEIEANVIMELASALMQARGNDVYGT